jgi:hypothetical protein
MSVNNTTYTIDTTENGREFVSEMDAVTSNTTEDGTEIVSEITTTASADDPTQVESHMTFSATAPDGTETVREVISNKEGTFIVQDESFAEEIIEALFEVEIPDELTPVDTDAAANNADNGDFNFTQNNSGADLGNTDFNPGGEMFANDFQSPIMEPAGISAPFDSGFEVSNAPFSTDLGGSDSITASDGTTASDYLYTDTSFDVEPVETSVTPEDIAYNAEYNADYADYYQDQADIAHDTAMDYAEGGDFDAAEVYAESAETHQTAADDWAGME